MTAFDLSPLSRTGIGFDRLHRLLQASTEQRDGAYPPCNIEKTGENAYRVTLAVAGFAEEDLNITQEGDVLTIEGRRPESDEAPQYLHRGIALRAFSRRFHLADHVKVSGASLVNGLLHVDLVRELPETARPRRIAIQ